jgi:hypothetical protein
MFSLTLLGAAPLAAATFERAPIAPELGLDVLTREVAREQLGRNLFSSPFATVTIGTVDIYDVFPYVETRTFQVVSDPAWNRLVCGEPGRSLAAYTGAATTTGGLSEPRGLAVDEFGRLFVADAGNDRVLVLQARTEFDRIELVPLFEIGSLRGPWDVAYSDGGTPFVPGDDVLYVADTGRNRIVAYALESTGARMTTTIGELGSGRGRFAGPMALAAGRSAAGHTRDLYVADAHNRRIVHLRHEATGLRWIAETATDAELVTSLDVDQWGNLYAAAPHQGVVRKFGPDLAVVAELRSELTRPRGFHLPFVTVRDHRVGSVARVGRPAGLSLDQWSDASGMRLWSLGVEVAQLSLTPGATPVAHFTLTDRADVTVEIADAATGRSMARRAAGTLEAGVHDLALTAEDLRAADGAQDAVVRLAAVSSYPDGPSSSAQVALGPGGAAVAAGRSALIGNSPNPVRPTTRIAFVLADADRAGAGLRVFDAAGRLVRTFDQRFTSGLNEVVWNGTDDRGRQVPAGVYLYRLSAGGLDFTRKMILVR